MDRRSKPTIQDWEAIQRITNYLLSPYPLASMALPVAVFDRVEESEEWKLRL